MREMLEVELYQHPWPMVLIPWSSGVMFTVQTSGLLVLPRSVEGICLPLYRGEYISERLDSLGHNHPGCCVDNTGDIEELPHATDSIDADVLDEIFQETHVPLKVDRQKLNDSCEAWVYVHVLPNNNLLLAAFVGQEAIFTWANCD